ncbi:MAG: pyrimidine 5'-nucleotidase [Hyphomicrobiaceae bacterium]|nr:pyrimidine 5'-nucleotidase [Hyphomicrobiaceae bacterium]
MSDPHHARPGASPRTPLRAAAPRDFSRTSVWIFDLDNTLYPAECNLFAEVDQRMGRFIAETLGVPFDHARYLQKHYYRQYGTTLAGLMQEHKLPPGPFLDYVHDIDLSPVSEHPSLRTALTALPGRRLIYTNGSRRHAERVAGKLGVLDLFEDIASIESCDFVPKPHADAFDRMIRRHGVDPRTAAMFEDMPHNLEAPHVLGMTTVLVHSEYVDHPVQVAMRAWTELPVHVHHMTDDLTAFLGEIPVGR